MSASATALHPSPRPGARLNVTFLLDQTLDHASRGALDLTEPDPIPGYEFDQSIPDDFDS